MYWVITFVVAVLLFQIVLFFVIRARKKKIKEGSILYKYDIKSASDAFRCINDDSIPAEDRKELERLYEGGEVKEVD